MPVEAAVQHAIGAPSPQEIAEQDLTGDALLAHELHQQMEDDFLQPKDELNDEGWEAVLPKKKRQGARTGAGRGNAPGPQGRIGRARIR